MGQKKFTQDEQRAIRDNPYVERVSETTITYTKEFKERFALEYAQGKPPSVILRACGFDPAMLGKKRRDGLVSKTREYAQRPEG